MSAPHPQPPPAPRKKRPAPSEEPGPAPANPRTRNDTAQHNALMGRVYEAMSTWHLDSSENRTLQMQATEEKPDSPLPPGAYRYRNPWREAERWTDSPADGHGASLFRSLVNLANTSTATREVFERRKGGMLDASKEAAAVRKVNAATGFTAYDNEAYAEGAYYSSGTNARSRRMMAEMQARDEKGRFAPGQAE